MDLFNNIFNADLMEINNINQRYIKILLVIILLIVGLLIIKKDYYYENSVLINEGGTILVVDKDIINEINNEKTILINGISSGYSINKIMDNGNICYVEVKLHVNIENISNTKYQILLGKETIFEYIIRIIKKIS